MSDFNLGQYYYRDSIYHRLDARTKLITTLCILVMTVFSGTYFEYALLFLYALVMKCISKIPVKILLRAIKPILILILVTCVFQLFTADGNKIWQYGSLYITDKGLYEAVNRSIRLFLLILTAAFLTFCTTPIEISDAMEILLKPLRRLGFPVGAFSLMVQLAIRFIPILTDKMDKIIKAQLSRGLDLESGTFIRKIKNLLPVFIPVIILTIQSATELGNAMEIRGYVEEERRTSLTEFKYKRNDGIMYAAVFTGMVCAVLYRLGQV